MTKPEHKARGVWFAVLAFCLWGVFPLYFKLLVHVPAVEILAYRCLLSFALLSVILVVVRRWRQTLDCFRSLRTSLTLLLSMAAILSNWGLFIYAIESRQVLQSSLAYFINPLVSVMLGVAFLHERLTRLQMLSIVSAVIGVLILTIGVGEFPWLALTLAFSFGLYGLLRKTVRVDGVSGLTIETGMATLPSLMVIYYIHTLGQGTLSGPQDIGVIAIIGPVTITPLLLFISAARTLKLSTVGMLQYITPTLHFLLAVFAFGEEFRTEQLISFAFIWLAVGIFLIDSRKTNG